MFFKEKKYEKNTLNKVIHTTFNPFEPGVVRVHLVPSKFSWFRPISCVAILNGEHLIPLKASWSILLSVFVENVNEYKGRELSQEQIENIVKKTILDMKEIYGKSLNENLVRSDLYEIINVFQLIVKGEELKNVKIPVLSISNYAKLMKAPHRMDLMISSMQKNGKWNCNQKCIHCYAAGEKEAGVEELSTEEWKKILDKCKKIGIPQVTFTGGEPTLRQDLVELVNYANWFVTRLNTNGLLLTKKLCSDLYKASLDNLQVTLYSFDEKTHNILVGGENYSKTIEGLKNAINSGLSVSVNTPLCKVNKDYRKTLTFLNDLGIKYVTCSGIIPTGNAKEKQSEDIQLTKEEMYKIMKEAVEYCNANLMEINFTSPGWLTENQLKELHLNIPSCGACLSNMAIAPDGTVIPCQSWLNGKEKLGNILEDKWEKIWNSKFCAKIRKKSCKGKNLCQLKGK